MGDANPMALNLNISALYFGYAGKPVHSCKDFVTTGQLFILAISVL